MGELEQKLIKTLDLFAGCGGSSYGAQLAGVRIVAAVDAWTTAKDTYLDNFKEVLFYQKLIEQINPIDIQKKVGHIDLIIASNWLKLCRFSNVFQPILCRSLCRL